MSNDLNTPPMPRRKSRKYKRARPQRFKIDTLADKAPQVVAKVQRALRENIISQKDILAELHEDLKILGIKTRISASAMSNYAKFVMANGHAIEQTRELAKILVERLGTTEGSDVELYIGELIKTAIAKAVKSIADDEKPDLTALRDAATALYRLSKARSLSLETRKSVLKEVSERIDEETESRGISPDMRAEFKRMLGIPVDQDEQTLDDPIKGKDKPFNGDGEPV